MITGDINYWQYPLGCVIIQAAKSERGNRCGPLDQPFRSLLGENLVQTDDRSDTERAVLSLALVRMAETHRRTLDQLSSGVAMFDGQQRLAFYNDSYRRLWDLDPAFLDGNPDDSTVLD
jgi:PAS domain-containing protein